MNASVILLGLLVAVGVFWWRRSEQQRKFLQKAVDGFVSSIFSSESYQPSVQVSWAYGVPCFTLCYRTREEQRDAESKGHSDSFVARVQELCGNIRVRGGKFDATEAVGVISNQEMVEWERQAAAYRASKK